MENHNSSASNDTTPLLSQGTAFSSRSNSRRQHLREAARFLRRSSSRRVMREPSMMVRETAAEQLEERQSDWAYSKPVVILDILWNTSFFIAAAVVLALSWDENPRLPLRLWILGYVAQCAVHIIFVCIEYNKRREQELDNSGSTHNPELEETSVAKYLESANTMFSFIWWVLGFYWVSAGGPEVAHESARLYWMCVVFLGFDVLFVVFCVALACVIGIAVCCCLPCIIAILYAVADQEGASKEDIERLSKYKFHRYCDGDKTPTDGGLMIECDTDSPLERALLEEDSECCICLSQYDDGVLLRELPCGHHFHCSCVDKWLHINATCPLCKHNILKNTDSWGEV